MDERIARAIIGAIREQDRSGYQIWEWLGPRYGKHEQLTEASLYPLLYQLEAERVIQGEWREGRPTRRLYRVAARGADMAADHGWPVLAKLRPEDRPAACHPATSGDGAGGEAAPAGTADAAAEPESPEDRAAAMRADYVARLDAGLRLSEAQRNLIRIEIGDHLEDCSRDLMDHGMDPVSAGREAVERLGSPETLAAAMTNAQLTSQRLGRGVAWGVSGALLGAALGIAGGATFILLAPLLARSLVGAGHLVGLYLYIPETPSWRAQQSMAALWVGAFMAARFSTRRVALYTRRSERTVRRFWAIGGAIVLFILAVLLPVTLDQLVAVGVLCIPVAFVVGVWQAQGQNDDPVSRRGIAAAAALLIVFLFAPGMRVWTYDPSAATPGAPTSAGSAVALDWENNFEGTKRWNVYVTGLDNGAWRDVRIEVWPTVRNGPFIGPDPNSAQPLATFAPGDAIDLARFEDASPEVWVSATGLDSSGRRVALASDIRLAATQKGPQSLVSWLQSR